MAVPLKQQIAVGTYIVKQRLMGRTRYPLVLMLEPLFRCNLACAGCGKIDYPDAILDKRLTVEECLDAVDECGAPIVVDPRRRAAASTRRSTRSSQGIVARKKFVSLCTNALLLEKKLDLFKPVAVPVLLGPSRRHREHHDRSVCQQGVFDKAVAAIKAAQGDAASASTSTAPSSTADAAEESPPSSTTRTSSGVDGIIDLARLRL